MAKRPSQKLTRHRLDAEAAKDLLAQLLPFGEGTVLNVLWGWRDRQANLRRARAIYADGWQADMFFSLPRNGQTSMTSYRMTWRGSIKGKAAA